MIIGLTGNFGSGKTTVSEMFLDYGFEVINVDKLYHDDIYKDKSFKRKVEKQFGTSNRNELKKKVFNDSKKLNELNKITHPLIIKKIKRTITLLHNKNKYDIIIDAPLLLETKTKNLAQKIIVIKTNKQNCIERLTKKGYSKNEIDKITSSQMPLSKKLEFADFVIDNNKDLIKTKSQVKKINSLLSTKN